MKTLQTFLRDINNGLYGAAITLMLIPDYIHYAIILATLAFGLNVVRDNVVDDDL
jgi:hypothetical protein